MDCAHFKTEDRWIEAHVSRVGLNKEELAYGVYSALHPDDDPWRLQTDRAENGARGWLEVRFKRLAPIRGVGVKGIMQNVKAAGFFPNDFQVLIEDVNRKLHVVARTKDHVGQEGEIRWFFPEPIKAAAVRIDISSGYGISVLNLYAGKGVLGSVRARGLPETHNPLKKKELTEEDVLDELEGL